MQNSDAHGEGPRQLVVQLTVHVMHMRSHTHCQCVCLIDCWNTIPKPFLSCRANMNSICSILVPPLVGKSGNELWVRRYPDEHHLRALTKLTPRSIVRTLT